MRIIPSDEYLALDTLYRRTLRAIHDALPEVPKVYVVDERNSRVEPHVHLNSWCESDMLRVPWDARMAIKSLDCYPLGLTIANDVQEHDPHIAVTCDHVRNGLLLTEFTPDADPDATRRTLVGINGSIQQWDCCCQFASSEDAAVAHALDLVQGFCGRVVRV